MYKSLVRSILPYVVGLGIAVALYLYAGTIDYTPRGHELGPAVWPRLAILLVEQNLRAAFAVGDRHHIMNKGEICFSGTSAEIEGNEHVLRNYLSV